MNIAQLTFNPFQESTYVVWDETLEAVIVDAGNSNEKENKIITEFIDSKALKPVMAINTHGHFDHIMGVEYLKTHYNIPFAMNQEDGFLIESAESHATLYGLTMSTTPMVDIDLKEMKEVTFGNTTLEIIPTPGHTPGHVCLFNRREKMLFTGDTVFKESIGRTDLPGGDYSWIMRSIIDKIIPLGDEVKIFPGHGPTSSIGHEVLYNPFIVEVLRGDVGGYEG